MARHSQIANAASNDAGRGGLQPASGPAGVSRKRPNAPHTTTTLRTEAWLLRGISSIPGELILKDGVIRFMAEGTGSAWPWQLRKLERELHMPGLAESIDRGDGGCVFQWRTDALQAWAPFHYFSGGIKLKQGNIVLAFSFGRPANMDLRLEGDAHASDVVAEVQKQLVTVRRMREHGKRWLAALAGRSSKN